MTLEQMAIAHRAGSHITIPEFQESLRAGFASTAELRLISATLAISSGDLLMAANRTAMTATNDRRKPLDADIAAFEEALGAFMDAARADLQG